jgi:hypothetical protein
MEKPKVTIIANRGDWQKIHTHLDPCFRASDWTQVQFREFGPRDVHTPALLIQGNPDPQAEKRLHDQFATLQW